MKNSTPKDEYKSRYARFVYFSCDVCVHQHRHDREPSGQNYRQKAETSILLSRKASCDWGCKASGLVFISISVLLELQCTETNISQSTFGFHFRDWLTQVVVILHRFSSSCKCKAFILRSVLFRLFIFCPISMKY